MMIISGIVFIVGLLITILGIAWSRKAKRAIDNWQRGYEDGYYETQEDFKRGKLDES